MPSPDRFLNGVSNVNYDSPFGWYPHISPVTWASHMEEMLVLPSSLGWTHTQTNGTAAVTSGTYGTGILTQTLGGADNDLSQMQATTATWGMIAGKKAVFEARVKVDKGAAGTIGEQELFIGLASVQTSTNFSAADGIAVMPVDDAIGFWSPDGSTNLNCLNHTTDVESIQVGAAVYADATWMTLSFYFDGTNIFFYKDGVVIAELTTYTTNAIGRTLFIKAGEAKPSVLSCDYLFVAKER